MADNQNFILAIVLSIAVLIGWQYFIAGPQMERAREAAVEGQPPQASQPSQAGDTSTPAPTTGDGQLPPVTASPVTPSEPVTPTGLTRDAALETSPRVAIATEQLSGSINLKGGRIDDLHLNNFHETVDPTSPTIILLSPANGPDGYFAEFGWIGTTSDMALPGPDTVWSVADGAELTTENPITLSYDTGAGLLFKRTIAVDDNYMFTVTDRVENSADADVALVPYGRVTRIGLPYTQGWYILHEGMVGVIGDEGLEQVTYGCTFFGGDCFDEDKKEFAFPTVDRGWLGITDKYWATTLIPEAGRSFDARFAEFNQPGLFYQADFRSEAVPVPAGGTAEITNRLFAGAKQVSIVDGYQESLGIDRFELLIDWGWFYFITKPLFLLIDWFFHLFGNFGVAILAVTVIIKLIFFPLANKSYKSMSMMKKVQPQMMEIRERYKDDRAKQQQALMELYKTEKINPVAGCWPMLIQIPVFFALYKVLFVTIEMRHAPFFGWIKDLAAPDPTSIFNLFGLIPWDPPLFLLIGVWPIVMGITMFIQMKLNPAPTDPTQQMIFTWMPIIFTFMLATFPAGLVIYWAWNNFLSIVQQWVIMRRNGVKVELWDNLVATFKRKPKPADTKS
jgi:YidC/Oxa1 family membrane protein insertase